MENRFLFDSDLAVTLQAVQSIVYVSFGNNKGIKPVRNDTPNLNLRSGATNLFLHSNDFITIISFSHSV